MSTHDATRARFAATADRLAALQERRAEELASRIRDFVPLTGDERALDAGAGTGALAFALAPLVQEVVAVELVPELIERGRAKAPPNVTFVEGNIEKLDFARASFDLAGTLRTLHHVPRPELVIAELTRVTRPGGTVLVARSSCASNASSSHISISPAARASSESRQKRWRRGTTPPSSAGTCCGAPSDLDHEAGTATMRRVRVEIFYCPV